MSERIDIAEKALLECENIIESERVNRKTMSRMLKAKNQELRNMIDHEKKVSLNDKVGTHMEMKLEDAVKERIQLKQEYDRVYVE